MYNGTLGTNEIKQKHTPPTPLYNVKWSKFKLFSKTYTIQMLLTFIQGGKVLICLLPLQPVLTKCVAQWELFEDNQYKEVDIDSVAI